MKTFSLKRIYFEENLLVNLHNFGVIAYTFEQNKVIGYWDAPLIISYSKFCKHIQYNKYTYNFKFIQPRN